MADYLVPKIHDQVQPRKRELHREMWQKGIIMKNAITNINTNTLTTATLAAIKARRTRQVIKMDGLVKAIESALSGHYTPNAEEFFLGKSGACDPREEGMSLKVSLQGYDSRLKEVHNLLQLIKSVNWTDYKAAWSAASGLVYRVHKFNETGWWLN